MIEKLGPFDTLIDDDFLDLCCGAGGLLATAILAGIANPKRCYGIEINPKMADICRKRLKLLGVPEENIHVGDALKTSVLKNYKNEKYKDGPIKGFSFGVKVF